MRTVVIVSLALLTTACGGNVTESGFTPADIPSDATPAPSPPSFAEQSSVREVAIFQGTKVSLARAGTRVDPNAPVVAGRPGLLRIYLDLAPRFAPPPLVAELEMRVGSSSLKTLTNSRKLKSASIESDLASTFAFDLDAESITPNLSYAVTIHPEGSPADAIRYPTEGFAPLGARAGAERVRMRIVPVRYDADGSGTLPDTGVDTVDAYRTAIFKLYPTARVEVDVRAPMPFATPIKGDGSGWDALIDALVDVRATDAPPPDIYYVGAFKPTGSMGKYCAAGCVLGVAPQAGPTAVSMRVAAIVSNSWSAGSTLAQELAHAMGRGHAPCGDPDRPDKKFPYTDGSIGVWGYDLIRKQLVDPAEYSDFMSYCQPVWVSDYTFKGLFNRIVAVNAEPASAPSWSSAPAAPSAKSMRIGRLLPEGRIVWKGSSPAPTTAPASRLTLRDGRGASFEADVHFFPFDNIAGGIVLADAEAPMWPFAQLSSRIP